MSVYRLEKIRVLAFVFLACIGCATRTGSASSPSAADLPLLKAFELETGLRLRRVASGAYEITHELPWPANSLLVEVADRSWVLVGTPYTPEATRRLLDWARSRFGERKIVAINTGFHVDNLGGNAALLDAHIPVYGSDLTVQLLRERGERTRQHVLEMIGNDAVPAYAIHATIPYLPPDHVFPIGQGLVLEFGAEEVRGIYPGPSQAPDKVVVFFPSRELLYGGCMILSGNRVGNAADADLVSWPRAVRSVAGLPASIVVPGHGDRLDPNLIQNTLDVLARATDRKSEQRWAGTPPIGRAAAERVGADGRRRAGLEGTPAVRRGRWTERGKGRPSGATYRLGEATQVDRGALPPHVFLFSFRWLGFGAHGP